MADSDASFCGGDHLIGPALTCTECRLLFGLEPVAPPPGVRLAPLRHVRPAPGGCGVGATDVELVLGWTLQMAETTCLACLDALGVLDDVLGDQELIDHEEATNGDPENPE